MWKFLERWLTKSRHSSQGNDGLSEKAVTRSKTESLNPFSTIQHHHLTTMPPLNPRTINPTLVSPRIGIENMDGQAVLSGQAKSYARPWPGCITIDQLTEDNLPPFYVRL